ncbi:MAG: GGDEF domain-containing protein [Phreatobacter sp.]|uniref:GGDEF domain-containing protein n=1 Tax=Phreatobacter sp. TaxID=1966341 RepID=UPI001A4879E0|nr:GGDEF domain-containing protein [Phreatobacter sp.]MBL8567729.1 GGDEF domain-containing protein [Phreatobacter sp.]
MSILDHRTLLLSLTTVALVTGLLLLISSRQNRDEPGLVYWGLANLVGAVGLILAGLRDIAHDRLTIDLANALIVAGYALNWAGMRRFCHRPAPVWVIAAPALVWLAFNQWPAFHLNASWRIVGVSLLSAAACFAAAHTLWNLKGERLVSRYPAVVWLILNGTVFLARVPPVLLGEGPDNTGVQASPAFTIILFVGLIHVTLLTFLQISLTKDRAEHRYRQAANTDMLTGAPNRRAFFDAAEPLVAAAARSNRPACAFVVDIDHFKTINDSLGHAAGDAVLVAVAGAIAAQLRPGDVFGRLGGEEFGCLLPDTDLLTATRLAEELRARIAALDLRYEGTVVRISVSIGIAPAEPPTESLDRLLAEADAGLYQAKRAGRDRVVAMDVVLR